MTGKQQRKCDNDADAVDSTTMCVGTEADAVAAVAAVTAVVAAAAAAAVADSHGRGCCCRIEFRLCRIEFRLTKWMCR